MIRRALFCIPLLAATLFAQGQSDWRREFPAFKITGNLYYIGASHYEQDLPLIRAALEKLDFKYQDDPDGYRAYVLRKTNGS